ncbi:glycosyltransferase family 4 protein [Alteromonas portus]|uniref:glycosyltransferase family 4 protein n=1 Tax=Alteromonas portus TaxID=2565549 RepID=UPI003BF85DF9
MSKRWIIIDPGFEHQDSHHMVVNSQIVSACDNEEVIIVAGKTLERENTPLNAEIIPFFDINLYPQNYHDLPNSDYYNIRNQFIKKLNEFFQKFELCENDCIVIHTAFSYLYEAIGRSLLSLNKSAYSIFISTMFSPGKVVEFGEFSTSSIREFMRHKFAFSLFGKLKNEMGIQIFIDSPTQIYVDAYQSIWPSGEIQLHPSVCGGGIEISKPSKEIVLAYLGGPKWDKGFEFTINAICEVGGGCPDKEFVFHYNDEFPGADEYQPLIDKLEKSNTPNITVIKGNLEKQQYEKLLASASCYLMLYDPEGYKYKTSGVLWDVLRHAQGKKVIVSENTWHEKELTLIGATFGSVEYGNTSELANLLSNSTFQPLSPRLYHSAYLQTVLGNFGEHIRERVKRKTQQLQVKLQSETKKILVVRTDYGHFTKLSGPGGFVEYLPENGYDVTEVLVPLGHENANFDDDGKRWEVLENFSKILKSYQINSFDIENDILKSISQFDVVHFVDGEHSGLVVAMAKMNGLLKGRTKIVATFHQPDYVMKDLVPKPSFLNAFDTIHLMSPCQKSAFLNLGVKDEKLVVVPHGVSIEHYKPSIYSELAGPSKNEIDNLQQKLKGRKVILTVGNWLRDYPTFLNVARAFREQQDFCFLAVSRGLELELTSLDKNVLLLNEGLADRTLHWLYRRAEVIFLPLKGGAANNAVLEAIAAKTPIVTTKLPSTEYYTKGQAVFCENADDFTSEISSLLNGKKKIESHLCNKELGWPEIARKTIEKLYK